MGGSNVGENSQKLLKTNINTADTTMGSEVAGTAAAAKSENEVEVANQLSGNSSRVGFSAPWSEGTLHDITTARNKKFVAGYSFFQVFSISKWFNNSLSLRSCCLHNNARAL